MYNDVLNFWFAELKPKMWWKTSDDLDRTIKERFGALHQQAIKGELFAWRENAKGSLAEIILLDQFSRNIFRNTPQAFANDTMALVLAQVAIEKKYHKQLPPAEKGFLFMPFMHSESRVVHELALQLYSEFSDAKDRGFELRHKAIIDRFGRYPHRNKILGRQSTEEEIEFLKQPNSKF